MIWNFFFIAVISSKCDKYLSNKMLKTLQHDDFCSAGALIKASGTVDGSCIIILVHLL